MFPPLEVPTAAELMGRRMDLPPELLPTSRDAPPDAERFFERLVSVPLVEPVVEPKRRRRRETSAREGRSVSAIDVISRSGSQLSFGELSP